MHLLNWLVLALFIVMPPSLAAQWEAERALFQTARAALATEQYALFDGILARLRHYPLHPYLEYRYLRENGAREPERVRAYLREYADLRYARRLQQQWLKRLAKAEDWSSYLEVLHLLPDAQNLAARYQCDALNARRAQGADFASLLAEVKALWLVGHSQAKQCDDLFAELYQHPQFDEALLWQRIRLAMDENESGLVAYLSKRLTDPHRQALSAQWLALHQQPAQALADFTLADSAEARKWLLHGLYRLGRKQPEQARSHWAVLANRYAFSDAEANDLARYLALRAAIYEHPQAAAWLRALPRGAVNDEVVEARFKLALAAQNWREIEQALGLLSEAEKNKLQWRYWRARAREQLGHREEAAALFRELAGERDYYGYLAADRLGLPHQLAHRPIQASQAELNTLLNQHPGLLRAGELFRLGLSTEARSEWYYATKPFTPRQFELAAALAFSWDWYGQAIISAAKAGHYDDVERRFPLAFRAELTAGAREQGLELAWVYGIARQESAFMADVRSHAGAMGLMQLMPATAKAMAKKIDLELNGNSDVLQADKNARLGSAYLRAMLDRFDGNYILATAAYNAGPGRSIRWREEHACLAPDAWIELIPFKETRGYVRSVLTYMSIFNQRLQQSPQPLALASVNPQACSLAQQ